MPRHAAIPLVLTLVAILPCIAQPSSTDGNLVQNPGMEATSADGVAAWESLVIGAPAEAAVDTAEKRGGKQSMRISAKEVTRSYLHGSPILVAPHEKLTISAWVKVKDVPADQGTVIAIAEFSRGEGTKEVVSKVGTAKVGPDAPAGWQRIAGTVEVPADVEIMRLRLGFSYSYGTAWWDDVTVTAEKPLVCLVPLGSPRVSPGREAVPVHVINRERARGPATVRVTLGKDKAEATVKLDGEPGQRVNVPLNITTRGPAELTAAVFRGETQVASHTRKVTVPKEGLELLPPIPTHWVIEDGDPAVAGEVDLAVRGEQREGSVLTARIVDARGAEKARWSSKAGSVVDGINAFSISAGALPAGDYKLAVELKPRRGDPLRAERNWSVIRRDEARTTINESGYPVHGGKPIFPLGMFNGGAKMKEMGEAGFTVTHAYNAIEAQVGDRLDDGRAQEFLDNTYANGMKAIMLVPRQLVFAGDWDGVRRRVRMFRNHPGLLAWDEEEGLARGDIKIDVLAKLRQVLREEDPHHPLMVGDSKDVIGRIEPQRRDFFPLEHMDLGMWWWYPIPLGGGKPEALEGDEGKPGSAELAPPSWLVNRNTDKPLWAGIQSYKKPKNGRYPNPTEYRAQAYVALLHGAKGLMWYGGSVTGGAYLKPEESNWDYLKKLSREMEEMSPVFMGKTETAPTYSPAAAPVSVMLKRAGDRAVLVAVNRGPKAAEVTFEAPSIKPGPVKVLYEDRTVTAAAGRISDTFEPYAAHVYELSR